MGELNLSGPFKVNIVDGPNDRAITDFVVMRKGADGKAHYFRSDQYGKNVDQKIPVEDRISISPDGKLEDISMDTSEKYKCMEIGGFHMSRSSYSLSDVTPGVSRIRGREDRAYTSNSTEPYKEAEYHYYINHSIAKQRIDMFLSSHGFTPEEIIKAKKDKKNWVKSIEHARIHTEEEIFYVAGTGVDRKTIESTEYDSIIDHADDNFTFRKIFKSDKDFNKDGVADYMRLSAHVTYCPDGWGNYYVAVIETHYLAPYVPPKTSGKAPPKLQKPSPAVQAKPASEPQPTGSPEYKVVDKRGSLSSNADMDFNTFQNKLNLLAQTNPNIVTNLRELQKINADNKPAVLEFLSGSRKTLPKATPIYLQYAEKKLPQ